MRRSAPPTATKARSRPPFEPLVSGVMAQLELSDPATCVAVGAAGVVGGGPPKPRVDVGVGDGLVVDDQLHSRVPVVTGPPGAIEQDHVEHRCVAVSQLKCLGE